MKIAMISSGFLPVVDGVSIAIFNRLQQLSDRGHTVLLLCPDYSGLQHIYPDWQTHIGSILPHVNVVPLESSPALGLNFERDVKPKAYQTVQRELQSFRPEIIHVDEPERLTCCFLKRPGLAYARKNNIPCIGFFHTNYVDYLEDYVRWPPVIVSILQSLLKSLFRWIYKAYDATLVASPSTYEKVQQMGVGNAVQDYFLGFNASIYRTAQRRPYFFEQTYGLQKIEETVKLLFVGRLTPDKGWAFTCHACQRFIRELDPATVSLIIVGDGPLREFLAQELTALFPHVYFLGRVAPQHMPALFANSDIHVTTSEKETTGLTVLEAQAAGIPVVAPRAGGLIDHIEHYRNGLLFNPQNQQDFVQQLKLLIETPTIRQEMGAYGQVYSAQYSWDTSTEKLLKFWQRQISQFPHLA